MENITISDNTDNSTQTQSLPVPPQDTSSTTTSNGGGTTDYKSTQLTSIEITSEVVALNVMVSFLNVAQKRGAFTIDESAKIWECIQKFVIKQV